MILGMNKQIKNLFLLLGSSVFSAALAVWFLVSHYSEGDRGYKLSHVLVSPSVIKQYADHRIDLVYKEKNKKNWCSQTLQLETYDKLYELLKLDIGLADESYPAPVSLDKDHAIRISIHMQDTQMKVTHGLSAPLLIQEMEIYPQGFYRLFYGSEGQAQWIYFDHGNIKEKIMDLL